MKIGVIQDLTSINKNQWKKNEKKSAASDLNAENVE